MRFLHIRTKLGVKWCQSLLQRPLRFQTLIFQTEEILNWAIFVNGNLAYLEKKLLAFSQKSPLLNEYLNLPLKSSRVIFFCQNVWVLRKTGLSVMQFDEFLNSIFVKSLWSWAVWYLSKLENLFTPALSANFLAATSLFTNIERTE